MAASELRHVRGNEFLPFRAFVSKFTASDTARRLSLDDSCHGRGVCRRIRPTSRGSGCVIMQPRSWRGGDGNRQRSRALRV